MFSVPYADVGADFSLRAWKSRHSEFRISPRIALPGSLHTRSSWIQSVDSTTTNPTIASTPVRVSNARRRFDSG